MGGTGGKGGSAGLHSRRRLFSGIQACLGFWGSKWGMGTAAVPKQAQLFVGSTTVMHLMGTGGWLAHPGAKMALHGCDFSKEPKPFSGHAVLGCSCKQRAHSSHNLCKQPPPLPFEPTAQFCVRSRWPHINHLPRRCITTSMGWSYFRARAYTAWGTIGAFS